MATAHQIRGAYLREATLRAARNPGAVTLARDFKRAKT
jgi:hypothetical protein